jgi:ribosomal protein S18 acetylase RimI-like enzyme
MIIRRSTRSDADAIVTCMLLAMEEIVDGFIGKKDQASAVQFLQQFTRQENNQYSWQNCHVAEVNKMVVGAINVYDGAALHRLRQPVVDHIHTHYNTIFSPEDETAAGEWYIDSLGVLPTYRCLGIGTTLLQFLINEYVQKRGEALGLLVEKENTAAKRLYLKLGFQTVGDRTLFGKKMVHLQCKTTFIH